MTITISRQAIAHRPSRWPALLIPFFALGLAAGLLLPSGRIARACSCMPPPPPLEALDKATDVFDGTVAGIEWVDPGQRFGAQRVEFVIHTQWKGVESGRLSIETAGDTAMCGYNFQLGGRYIVYTEGEPESPLASNCSRTRPWSEEEAAALGPDEPPDGAMPWMVWDKNPPPSGCPRCAAPPPPAQARDESDATFHGRVIGLEYLGPDGDFLHRVRFLNMGWWKGPSSASIDIFLPWSVWSCEPERWNALEYAEAEGHIVYAKTGADGRLQLELCDRTRAWDAAEAAALGAMNKPDPGQDTPTPPPAQTLQPGETPIVTPSTGPPSVTPTPDPFGTATPATCPTLECPGCAGPRPAEEWLEEADAVFHGRVVTIIDEGCDHRVYFDVDETWKGPAEPRMEVFIDMMAWQCSRRFSRDEEVVVFARADADGGLYVPMCFGIVNGDARDELGPGRPVGIPIDDTPGPVGGRIIYLPQLSRGQ